MDRNHGVSRHHLELLRRVFEHALNLGEGDETSILIRESVPRELAPAVGPRVRDVALDTTKRLQRPLASLLQRWC